jgi:hypothetical protein
MAFIEIRSSIAIEFASTFTFFTTHRPTQKKIKELASQHPGQCIDQYKIDTEDLRQKRSPAGNTSFALVGRQFEHKHLSN